MTTPRRTSRCTADRQLAGSPATTEAAPRLLRSTSERGVPRNDGALGWNAGRRREMPVARLLSRCMARIELAAAVGEDFERIVEHRSRHDAVDSAGRLEGSSNRSRY